MENFSLPNRQLQMIHSMFQGIIMMQKQLNQFHINLVTLFRFFDPNKYQIKKQEEVSKMNGELVPKSYPLPDPSLFFNWEPKTLGKIKHQPSSAVSSDQNKIEKKNQVFSARGSQSLINPFEQSSLLHLSAIEKKGSFDELPLQLRKSNSLKMLISEKSLDSGNQQINPPKDKEQKLLVQILQKLSSESEKSIKQEQSKSWLKDLTIDKLLSRTVCYITFYWFDGNSKLTSYVQGTGFLISKNHLLTARHNIYRSKDNRKCNFCQIQFKPFDSKTGLYSKDNLKKTFKSHLSSLWLEHKEFDLALVQLSQVVEDFYPQIHFCSTQEIQILSTSQTKLFIAGYSIQHRKEQKNMVDRLHKLNGVDIKPTSLFLQYSADTLPGYSGSPVIMIRDNKAFVVGMHLSRKVSPSKDCRGLFFKTQILQQINLWNMQMFIKQQNIKLVNKKVYQNVSNGLELMNNLSKNQQLLPSKSKILEYFSLDLMNSPSNQVLYEQTADKLKLILNKTELIQFFQKVGSKWNRSSELFNHFLHQLRQEEQGEPKKEKIPKPKKHKRQKQKLKLYFQKQEPSFQNVVNMSYVDSQKDQNQQLNISKKQILRQDYESSLQYQKSVSINNPNKFYTFGTLDQEYQNIFDFAVHDYVTHTKSKKRQFQEWIFFKKNLIEQMFGAKISENLSLNESNKIRKSYSDEEYIELIIQLARNAALNQKKMKEKSPGTWQYSRKDSCQVFRELCKMLTMKINNKQFESKLLSNVDKLIESKDCYLNVAKKIQKMIPKKS